MYFLGIRIMVGNNMRFVQILIMEENIENIVQDAIEVIGSLKECNNKTHEKTI